MHCNSISCFVFIMIAVLVISFLFFSNEQRYPMHSVDGHISAS
jgi:hypothetical protein